MCRLCVEEDFFVLGNELYFLVEFSDGGFFLQRIVDAVLLIHHPVFLFERLSKKNQVNVLTFLLDVSDGGNVFSQHFPLHEYKIVFLGIFCVTDRGYVFVFLCQFYGVSRNVFQVCLHSWITSIVDYT